MVESVLSAFQLIALALVQGGSPSAQEMTRLARVADSVSLFEEVRDRPDDAREAIRLLFGRATSDGDERSVDDAQRLARALAYEWADSFQVREVSRFRALSSTDRSTKMAADSVRREGITAYARDGPNAALALWRESFRLARLISDTAEMAASMGNIGAAFYTLGFPDSARAYLEASRERAATIGARRTHGNALNLLASVADDEGETLSAYRLYEQALELHRAMGDTGGIASDLNNLAIVRWNLGDLSGAREVYRELVQLNRERRTMLQLATNQINLGALAHEQGEYARAEEWYRSALRIYRDSAAEFEKAFALHSLGRLGLSRGQYLEARRNLGLALDIYQATGPVAAEIEVRRDLAAGHAAVGSLQEAQSELRRAQETAREHELEPQLMADLALTAGDISLMFNDPEEAERNYREAELWYADAGDRMGLGQAQHGQGIIELLREEWDRALVALQAAANTEAEAGDRRGHALTLMDIGFAHANARRELAAREALYRALEVARSSKDTVTEAVGLVALGDVLLDLGFPDQADSVYALGLEIIGGRPIPTVTWRLHAGRGTALLRYERPDRARQELSLAVADIEQTSMQISLEERRAYYLADKWDVYTELARAELRRGRPEDAFQVSERIRASGLAHIMSLGTVNPRGLPMQLVRREKDLRRRIGQLSEALERTSGPSASDLRELDRRPLGSDAVRLALQRAQAEYGSLLLEMREADPEYAAMIQPEAVSWSEAARLLERDQALVEYLVSDSGATAFVVSQEGVEAVELDANRESLAALVDFARGTLERVEVEDSVDVWRRPLKSLYAILVEPLEDAALLDGKRTLLIVPHTELHYLPFDALITGTGEYLIEKYDIARLPSASAWVRLSEGRRYGRAENVLAFAPRPEQLPGSVSETQGIAELFGESASALVGKEASEGAFLEAVRDKDVIHLAGFGYLNKRNPLFSYVELHPDAAADGRVEVHEVFDLDLSARLVVLSACRTGLGSGALADVPEGDDWVGLVQAFLHAGAGNVMATIWLVEDRSTGRLMRWFYEEYRRGRGEIESLAAAKRRAIRSAETAHPFYWAGFVLVQGADTRGPTL